MAGLPGIISYRVSRRQKQPLLEFLLAGLQECGCAIVYASEPDHEPFVVSFDTPGGERIGAACYVFLANSKVTRNRPDDEHRFQVKLGSDPRRLLEMHSDPTGLLTTLFIGVDLERGFVVSADPALHNPSPMFKSVEFKRRHAAQISAEGWMAWERDRRANADEPVEVLVGATRSRLLDLIRFERAAQGLDQGHRHLLAEKFAARSEAHVAQLTDLNGQHGLLKELGIGQAGLLDLISGTARLKMAVRGWVAELHLVEQLGVLPGVSDCERIVAEGQPDVRLRWRGSGPVLIECKNVLRKVSASGAPRLDFQRTRASKADPCSRYYRPSDFGVVAACLHSVTERWEFRFADTRRLAAHPRCQGRLQSSVIIDGWPDNPASILDAVAGMA